ncbi:Threonine/homoserine/homoserine lactone efflux protein [Rhizobium sp. RU20A]|uniref:LysE family translocator n=1 Tax=Rhizobium sp. RU20A TaxID=1907412 RepID=UPI00095421B8|nr:hypothetical protein [Rhizobium sp. RU20A]SIQ61610.1 Threonine/homoserine/homoserine lactone efflux protein [Rhizobium sp. RU20A]
MTVAMSLAAFCLAVLLLLATPGPTNTMLALAGAERQLGAALRLLPIELCGYLAVVVPLSLLAPLIGDHHPVAALLLKGGAALWLLVIGLRLWLSGRPGQEPLHGITARTLFLTTLLNPKGLMFGLVLVPDGTPEGRIMRLFLLALMVVSVGALWVFVGRKLSHFGAATMRPHLLRRGAAVALFAFSATLAGSALATGFSS